MASAWFDSVTGSNDYERQSYRDSYNGGKAAGDWTGNVNKNLDAERAAFQGSTWSGSSTQPSALQTAQIAANPATPPSASSGVWVSSGMRGQKVWVPTVGPAANVAGGSPTNGPAAVASGNSPTAGPGNAGASNAAPAAAPVHTEKPKGGPGIVEQIVGPAPLEKKTKLTATGGFAGFEIMPNPYFSDVENLGEPRYGEPGEWLGGIINIGADIVFNTARAADAFHNSDFIQGTADSIDQVFADGFDRVTAPIPKQEPVDWGH